MQQPIGLSARQTRDLFSEFLSHASQDLRTGEQSSSHGESPRLASLIGDAPEHWDNPATMRLVIEVATALIDVVEANNARLNADFRQRYGR